MDAADLTMGEAYEIQLDGGSWLEMEFLATIEHDLLFVVNRKTLVTFTSHEIATRCIEGSLRRKVQISV